MRNIHVQLSHWADVDNLEVELVERKGTGHPDFIADSASEEASKRLSLYYLKNYGVILHHNLDKTLVVGGQAVPRFKGGEVVQPIYIIVSGRATTEVKTESGVESVPVGTIIIEAVKDWLRNNFRYLDPEMHVVVDYKVGKGSADLVGIFQASKGDPLSNDTSFGVGFYPYSTLENLVYSTERLLNSKEFKAKVPEVGEDVKVMGLRKGKDIELTIAMAVISKLVSDVNNYLAVKEEVKQAVLDLASKIAPSYNVRVNVNTGDRVDKGILYLTVTGTSAEHGDDGMTGRGNRASGLITPMRPMSLEATAGKNPVNHVGKMYNVLANVIAKKVVEQVKDVKSAQVEILGQIGRPISDPLITNVQVHTYSGQLTADIRREIEGIADEQLARVTKLTEDILEGRAQLF
ncbi:MAG: methionine adenosyltransferase [Sulfolobales archaeon]|jgi:S-adenosylmethionine synthetase|nr:methionine adenosyltransferase [Sulfolobales archaeon]MCQ4366124.1 methionine adenosyltransferase [Sulfolobales archaeon]MCQ4384681.1 methionine adenosyltransferase [Sulfolobales archaeon]MCQ4406831.1 methionine adenosyltransferase [Sulfolobales archaeon]MCQ4449698.1 methionine adenosyltransferase [Sulfolobales archaeon]